MRRFIVKGPRQLTDAANAAQEILPLLKGWTPYKVILAGMGGSALGGGIVEALSLLDMAPDRARFHVARDYELRVPVSPETLVMAISYSGETEETLSAYRQAVDGGARVIAVASGGALLDAAAKDAAKGVLSVRIPPQAKDFQPRFSLYFTSGLLLSILDGLGFLRRTFDATALRADLEGRMDAAEAGGPEIAQFLEGRIPVVYSSSCLEFGLARIWRIKLHENAKIPALSGSLPEANHNEMIGFDAAFAEDFAFLLLPDPWMHPRVKDRFRLFAEVMERQGYPCRSVPLAPDAPDPLTAIYGSLLLADWVTAALAEYRGVDPVSIPVIQDFKARLGPWKAS